MMNDPIGTVPLRRISTNAVTGHEQWGKPIDIPMYAGPPDAEHNPTGYWLHADAIAAILNSENT